MWYCFVISSLQHTNLRCFCFHNFGVLAEVIRVSLREVVTVQLGSNAPPLLTSALSKTYVKKTLFKSPHRCKDDNDIF